jgi:mannose-1-phosphate guanylyltransferase
MHNCSHTWGLVLAAGEGTRLQSLTATTAGVAVPKQFCSLYGGPSLLQEALLRALQVAPIELVCAVVAAQHRCWWEESLPHLPTGNIFVQPDNRGTAHGVLLPLMHILMRDVNAVVVVLPADHHVLDEKVLGDSLRRAVNLARSSLRTVYLLGIEPDEPDPELGYIIPAQRARDGSAKVSQLIEKPASDQVRALFDNGVLWNAFIVVASARALVGLFEKRFISTIMDMLTVARRRGNVSLAASAAARLYQHLSPVDFFRDVLEGQEAKLRVLPVPKCGWADLGTPRCVTQALRRLPAGVLRSRGASANTLRVNLAIEHERRQPTESSAGIRPMNVSA